MKKFNSALYILYISIAIFVFTELNITTVNGLTVLTVSRTDDVDPFLYSVKAASR